MIVTNKEDYKPLTLNAREVLDVTDCVDFSKVLMKNGELHVVDEREYHIRSLMLVELISNAKGKRNEKV